VPKPRLYRYKWNTRIAPLNIMARRPKKNKPEAQTKQADQKNNRISHKVAEQSPVIRL
jgi:hypothetical protein